jgi:divalent metal cation (Fe/Co/Zn/Cd) transporter
MVHRDLAGDRDCRRARRGIAARSLTLVAFGADSVIELLSAGLLLWRLMAELEHGEAESEAAERLAGKIAAGLLFALSAYVVASAAWGLWHREGQEFSRVGLAIAIAAIPVMIGLAQAKRRLAVALGSSALRADAAEAIACTYLSGVVFVGLGAQLLLGWWWIDALTALCIVPFLVHEGREAWEGEECGEDKH